MRTFVAIELPSEVRTALGALGARLRASGVRASWVKPENIHLTLRFLGEVDGEHVERLSALLVDAYRGVAPFRVLVRATGAFPNTRRPSVVWVGVEPVDCGLGTVQTAAESAARAIGLAPDERLFRAHLTLARIKDDRVAGPLMALLEQERDFAGGEFTVGAVSLFSSQLTPRGPIYERLREFSF